MDNFPFGNDEVKKQLAQTDGDAKEFANGEPLDSDDGGKIEGADTTANGSAAPAKGKSFNC